MGSIRYIAPEDLIEIIDIIRSLDYSNSEEIPRYDEQPDKIDDYFSLIDRLQNDTYYPDVMSKAAVLFLNLNSHYFENGNKRLAVVSTVFFLENNGWVMVNRGKKFFAKIIRDSFCVEGLKDYENFSSKNFAMYNVALITAQLNQNNVSFEEGKRQTKVFLEKAFTKRKE